MFMLVVDKEVGKDREDNVDSIERIDKQDNIEKSGEEEE